MPADTAPTSTPDDGGATRYDPGRPAAATATVDVSAARAALSEVAHEPGAKKPDPIVVADNIRRTFGGLTAVDVDHLEIQRGVITGLIGPNGAGKTTFFNLLTGFDRPDEGDWSFNGRSLKGVPAYRVSRMGMVRTFQLTKVLSRLTVLENMRVGATGQRGESLLRAMFAPFWRRQESDNTEKADNLLERFLLIKKREDFAGSLSGGQRKLLEMARALMTDPKLIMLDEPMAGVNPALKQSLLDHIRGLKEEGRTVLFVEHDMDMVQEISDWVIVLAEGRLIAEGTARSISGNREVIDAYLGAHHDVDIGALGETEAIEELGLDAEELGLDQLEHLGEMDRSEAQQ
jgi:branched-chain amino acid transport system ATP-binding protein